VGWRFRRSIKVLPGVRLNLSRRGISTTIGVRGASVNLGKRGAYVNVGLPGTGLSYRQRIGGAAPGTPAPHPTSSGGAAVSAQQPSSVTHPQAASAGVSSRVPKYWAVAAIVFLVLGVIQAGSKDHDLNSTLSSTSSTVGTTAPAPNFNAADSSAGLPAAAASNPPIAPTANVPVTTASNVPTSTPPLSLGVMYVRPAAVNIRAQPSMAAEVVATAEQGHVFHVFATQPGWVQVGDDVPKGWVFATLLGQVP
jgi:hypothetical protein